MRPHTLMMPHLQAQRFEAPAKAMPQYVDQGFRSRTCKGYLQVIH